MSTDFDIASPDGVRLQGRAWTVDKPRAIINLIHGLGEHCGRYDHLAAHFNANNISVYAVDLHGHGLTEGKRGVTKSVSVLVTDVSALLEFSLLQNPNVPHILMGHSMGGNVVLSYGYKYPAAPYKAIITQAPLIKPADKIPGILKTMMAIIAKIAPNFSIQAKLEPEKISTLPAEQKAYAEDPLNHRYLGAMLGLSLFAAGETIAGKAAQFPFDVLVTHGTEDRLTDYDASQSFAAACPRADFISYEDSGHEVHNDLRRDQVYADLTAWILKRV